MIKTHSKDPSQKNHAAKAVLYQCNKCMSIERIYFGEQREQSYIVPCTQCSGFAIKMQLAEFQETAPDKLKNLSGTRQNSIVKIDINRKVEQKAA